VNRFPTSRLGLKVLFSEVAHPQKPVSENAVSRELAANSVQSGIIENSGNPFMERASKHRSDLFWYVLTGLLALFAIGIYVVYVPEGKGPDRKWTEFVFYSSMLFVMLAKIYWRIRRQLKLWLVMLEALVLHVSVYVPLLARIKNWPPIRCRKSEV
jgi:hypothetical protein